jgi:hypothetical protein
MHIVSRIAFVGKHIIKKFTSDDIKTIDVLKAGRQKCCDLLNDNSTYQDYSVEGR